MTLRSEIASDASTVFLNTDDFAQTVYRNPYGDAVQRSSLSAIVMMDVEPEGPNALPIDDDTGRRITRYAQLEILETVDVNVSERPELRDTWTIGSEEWWTVRVTGRDGVSGTTGLQTVLVARTERIATKQTRATR